MPQKPKMMMILNLLIRMKNWEHAQLMIQNVMRMMMTVTMKVMVKRETTMMMRMTTMTMMRKMVMDNKKLNKIHKQQLNNQIKITKN